MAHYNLMWRQADRKKVTFVKLIQHRAIHRVIHVNCAYMDGSGMKCEVVDSSSNSIKT